MQITAPSLGFESSRVAGTVAASVKGARLRVAIIGGGIGGLALATFLAKSNRASDFDIAIYETKPSLTELGAGVGIWLRTWKILASAGLEEDLKRVAPEDRDIVDLGRLQKAFEFRRGDRSPEGRSFYSMEVPFGVLMLHRADFQNALARQCIPPASPHFGKKLVNYEYADDNDPCSEIVLNFADGSTALCDVLVGADGIRSVVRREMIRRLVDREEAGSGKQCLYKLDPPRPLVSDLIEPVWSGTIAYRSLILLDALEKRFPGHRAGKEPVVYFGKSRHIIAFPIRTHGTTQTNPSSLCSDAPHASVRAGATAMVNLVVFVSDSLREGTRLPDGEPWVRPASREEVLQKFKDWEEEAVALIELVEKPMAWMIHTVKALPTYCDALGRVVLLGDAAHAMTPHQGAGGGQAIEDAYVLAALLTHPRCSSLNIGEALRTHDSVRVPASRLVAETSRLNGMMYEFNHSWDEGSDQLEGVEKNEMMRLMQLANTIMECHKWEWEEDANSQVVEAIKVFEESLAGRS